MEINNHLDKIFNLGFNITIDWNQGVFISYAIGDNLINIMMCYYESNHGPFPYTFEDMIETFCDFFYEWHNINGKKVNLFSTLEMDELNGLIYGDITKRVIRNLGIDVLKIDD